MPAPKLMCPDCKNTLREVERRPKTAGHQRSEEIVGYHILYECSCGYRWWEYKSKN